MTEEHQQDVRIDPLTGDRVVITGGRQKRPNQPATGCPFCPGGLEAPEPYDVFSFVNRWPALGAGRAEVVLYCSEHEGALWSLPLDHVRKVIDLWEQRSAVLGARPDVGYVLVFENRGPEVGATIAHPHGQIYAFGDVPAVASKELERQECALCASGSDEQVVVSQGEWSAWVPYAASWPYEMLIAPRSHFGDLTEAREHHHDFAAVLRHALAKLDHLFDSPMPYMMWMHQRPVDGGEWPQAHLHVHVAPIYRAPKVQRFVAAGELGSGVFFNPVVPEEAAAQLREAEGAS